MKNLACLILALMVSLTLCNNMWFDYRNFGHSQKGDYEEITIACEGGSGNYYWEYAYLPKGWTYNNNIIYIPTSNIVYGQYYGFKVQVSDRVFNDRLRKSMFISINSGIEDVFDSEFTD